MKQKLAFSEGEGDAWFERNKAKLGVGHDPVEQAIDSLQLRPERILELGRSNGYRLENLRTRFSAHCVGLDPSRQAIMEGKALYLACLSKLGQRILCPLQIRPSIS